MARYVGAIDQGTTSTRFIVFDRGGNMITSAQKEHSQIFPKPGWVEHDPIEIWQNTQEVAGAALARASLGPSDLAAVGITNQRETTVLWNQRSGKPLHNALVWQDTRVDQLVAQYARNGGANRFRTKTGLPLASYFSGLKLQWLLDNVPGARAKAQSGELLFGNIDTWLLWNLTGGSNGGLHLTDVTNASRTQLMNLETLDWDEELLEEFLIPRAVLPRIVASSEVYGAIRTPALLGTAGRRYSRRPASGVGGSSVLPAGRGEEHLRNGLLSAHEHGRETDCLDCRADHHGSATKSPRSGRATPWKDRSPSPAHWCSGCAIT